MKKIHLFLISFLVGLVLFAWVIKFVGWGEIKKSLLIFTGWKGIMILVITLFLRLVSTLKWKEILKSKGVNVGLFNLFEYYLAGLSVMYLFPSLFLGGEFVQSYFLKTKNSVGLTKGMAASVIDQILDWTSNLVVIFLGIIFFLLKITFLPKKILLFLMIAFLFCLLVITLFYLKVFKKESIIKFFLKIFYHKENNDEPFEIEKEIYSFFQLNKFYFWKIIFLDYLVELFYLLRICILISFLGESVTLLLALSILAFSYLALLIPIPAALGVHEGFQAFVFNALGLGANVGTAFTLIIRGADLLFALIGILILFRFGSRLLIDKLFNKQNH
jgi:uncharacterized protein (TIRG00374 family)